MAGGWAFKRFATRFLYATFYKFADYATDYYLNNKIFLRIKVPHLIIKLSYIALVFDIWLQSYK